MTTWTFQAKPQDFDIDAFPASRPTKAKWRASAPGMDRKCRVGDRVFLWRAKGTGAQALAGVVAEGTVCGPVVEQADDSAAARFWTDRAAARFVEPRVEIAMNRFAAPGETVPRDELKDDPVLGGSALMKAGIETNFLLTAEQQARVSRLWDDALRKWQHADLVAALAFQPGRDAAGLAVAQGRYFSACRRALAAFEDWDPKSTRRPTRPRAEVEAAWNEVFGSARQRAPKALPA